MPNREIAGYTERAFHELQKDHCLMGEWFNMEPGTATKILEIYLVEGLNLFTSLSNKEKDMVWSMCRENYDAQ